MRWCCNSVALSLSTLSLVPSHQLDLFICVTNTIVVAVVTKLSKILYTPRNLCSLAAVFAEGTMLALYRASGHWLCRFCMRVYKIRVVCSSFFFI